MLNKKTSFACIALVILILVSCATGRVSWEDAKDGQTVVVSGVVGLFGNEPFTKLMITDDDGKKWSIDKRYYKDFYMMERRRVTVRAVVVVKEQILADGKVLPPLKVLTDIEILKK